MEIQFCLATHTQMLNDEKKIQINDSPIDFNHDL